MKKQINRAAGKCLWHSYEAVPVVTVTDGISYTKRARICTGCGHCHAGDWQRARDYLEDALAAGLPVEAAACLSRLPAAPARYPLPLRVAASGLAGIQPAL